MAYSHTATAPDYDAWLMNAPQRYEVPGDALQCKQCGEIAYEDKLTEVQLELHTCSEQCAYLEVRDLKARAAKAPRAS